MRRSRGVVPIVLGVLALLGVVGTTLAQDAKDGGTSSSDGVLPDAGKTIERTIKSGIMTRTYRLHVPKGMTKEKRAPLVVCLHGAGGTGKIQEGLSRFDEVSDEKGFLVAYPDGKHRMWLFTDRNDLRRDEKPEEKKPDDEKTGDEKKADDKKDEKDEETPTEPRGDIGFICNLADELVAEGLADSRRVYLTGISNGGYMTNKLALEVPEKFAAFAPVAGTIIKAVAQKHTVKHPVSVCYVHGTEDRIVGYDGKDFLSKRGASLGAEELVDFWVTGDGCSKEAKVEQLPHKEGEGPTVERRSYGQGKDGSEVVFYKVVGGGHTWPGGTIQPEKLLGKTAKDLDASRAIWDFFSRHALPEAKTGK